MVGTGHGENVSGQRRAFSVSGLVSVFGISLGIGSDDLCPAFFDEFDVVDAAVESGGENAD